MTGKGIANSMCFMSIHIVLTYLYSISGGCSPIIVDEWYMNILNQRLGKSHKYHTKQPIHNVVLTVTPYQLSCLSLLTIL